MYRPRTATLRATCVLLGLLTPSSAGILVARSPDSPTDPPRLEVPRAYVSRDDGVDEWTIGNANIALRLGRSSTGGIVVLGLDSPATGIRWNPSALPDETFLSGSNRLTPGQATFGFRSARVDETAGGVRLALVFEDPAHRLRVTRFYACSATAPAIETWSSFEAIGTGAAIPISDIGVWQLSVQASAIGWVTGADEASRFTTRHESLVPRESFGLGSTGRSSTSAVPVLWLTGPEGHLFSGLMWSGSWGVSVDGPGASGRVAVRWTAGGTATTVKSGAPVDTPHAFFGVAGTTTTDVTLALATFMTEGVRRGRPLNALVTYNTWFAYGIDIDEERMRAEVDHAAAMGVELFVLDAGYYVGGTVAADFDTGLGNWKADPRRFPSGLRALADYTRSRGMRFGIWMEPERVDTRLLNHAGMVSERALATTGGRYNAGVKNVSATTAQICLADAAGRQWVLDQIVRIVEDVKPDYLKWDNNYWINCDRTSHGHGAADGNFAHVTALYSILATLRERYPDLLIENCSGGGRRLDFGMLRYSDVGWMDDTTAPSAYVRHNLEGLGTVFPSAYLLSFVIDSSDEPIHSAADVSLYFRSRMAGILGVTLRGEEFRDDEVEDMAREVALAKQIRGLVPDASMIVLTNQVDESGSEAWDAVQLVSGNSGTSVLLAFAGSGASDSAVLKMRGVSPGTRYTISTAGGRRLADTSGATLMEEGIRVRKLRSSASVVLVVAKLDQSDGSIR